jgi:putative transposase
VSTFAAKPLRLKGFDYSAERSYFVTFCVKNRAKVFADPRVAQIAVNVILRYRTVSRYFLYAYCVMPDHIHMLLKLRPAAGNLSTVVAVLKASIRHAARPFADVQFMRGFHDRIKREHEDLHEFVKYMLRNPVRAGLVADASDYPFLGRPDAWR